MKVTYRHVFEVREPPRGGLSRLRARLDTSRRHAATRARALWLAATCVVAVAIVLVVSRFELIRHREGPSLEVAALVSPGDERASDEPVSVPESARGATAVQRVVLPNDNVVFYLVLSVN